MKNRRSDILVLIAYSVPYVFLGMYGDFVFFSMWPYLLMVIAPCLLAWRCAKTGRLWTAVAGNLLSTATSFLCVSAVATERWNYFFKAFPVTIRMFQFAGIVLAVQAVIYWITAFYAKEKDAS